MPRLKSIKQERFAQLLVKTGKQTQSYIDAWYTWKTPETSASHLANNSKFLVRLDEIRNKIEERELITLEEVINWFKMNAVSAYEAEKYWDSINWYDKLMKYLWGYIKDNGQKNKIELEINEKQREAIKSILDNAW